MKHLMLALSMATLPAFSQDWMAALQPVIGKRVQIVTKRGDIYQGKLSSVTPDQVAIGSHGVMPRVDVQVVRQVLGHTRGQHVRRGFLIGAGLGIAVGLSATVDSTRAGSRVIGALGYGANMGFIGLLIGGTLPQSTHYRLVYRAD